MENVDPEEELTFGAEMQKNREEFVERYKAEEHANAASILAGKSQNNPADRSRRCYPAYDH